MGVFELCSVRDKEKREVDFLILRDRAPWLLAECRLSDLTPSPALRAFSTALAPTMTLQVVAVPDVHERFDLSATSSGTLVSADKLLRLLV